MRIEDLIIATGDAQGVAMSEQVRVGLRELAGEFYALGALKGARLQRLTDESMWKQLSTRAQLWCENMLEYLATQPE
jgi:hypothetical protein